MSYARQASFNPTLTSYAQGLAQDLSSAVAELIAPTVPVASTIGQFKKYNSANAFQSVDTSRAMGGGAKRIEMSATDPSYNCKPQALEITIDDAEMDAAGPQSQQLIESKIKVLVSTATISHERKVIVAANAAVTATANKGVWSPTETNSPIVDIDGEITDIVAATGIMPNTIVFGLSAWGRFRVSSKVTAFFPGSAKIGINTTQAQGLFINPSMQIVVAPMVYDSVKFGGTSSLAGIVGSDVWIFYRSATPTIYDASFMKTFMGSRGGVQAVRSYRDESARSMVYAVDWTEDIQVPYAETANRLTTS